MKLNTRKQLLSLAVASAVSGGAMLMAAPAYAVNVSQNNMGEVLLFPYYTVKNDFDTVFTVTNTTDKTAVFKIRFREALNSREVRDFNVILSPYDHWGAAITKSDTGAVVRTFDKTCTSPQLPASTTKPGATEVAFTNELYAGNFTDGATGDISRVQEGYFEVFLMGLSSRSTSSPANLVEYNAKHVNGVPRDCGIVDAQFLPGNIGSVQANFRAPDNVLKGHVTYINVPKGQAIDAEPTAIEDFRDLNQYIFAPADVRPDLTNGDNPISHEIVDGAVISLLHANSQDAVSSVLRASSVINEFATGSDANSNTATSWVVTFPSKHHYTDLYAIGTGPTLINGVPSGGFSEWFYNSATDGKSCDNITVDLVNREEGRVQTVDTTQFSPYNPSAPTVALCYEANVIDFNGTNVFGGTGVNRLGISTTGVGSAGWANLMFTEAPAVAAGGLPVIGFAAILRNTSAGASTSYASSTEHSYQK